MGIKKASLAYKADQKSIGVPVGLDGSKYRLKLIIRNLENLQKEIDAVEDLMNRYLLELGYLELLLSIQ